MKKGDYVKFEYESKTMYGCIVSIINDVAMISFHSYQTGETKATQLNINQLTKIGNK
jgi:hypothetical protein